MTKKGKNATQNVFFLNQIIFMLRQFSNFALDVNLLIMGNSKNINRLKAVLADAGQTNKWLAEQLGKDPVTVSKWCTNTTQPDLQTLSTIAEVLGVNIRELLVETKPQS